MSETVVYYYTYLSDAGPLTLFPEGSGYKVLMGHEDLGAYSSLQEAFIATVSGETQRSWSGGSLADLDVPSDLADWQRKVFAVLKHLRPA